MNKLPVEVGQSIIKLLHQQDIQQCMLICRDWANWIRTNHFFNTVCITTQSGLDKFVESLHTNPALREQVRRLIIELPLRSDFDINTLTPYFSKLRVFYFNDTSPSPKVHAFSTPQPWFDTIFEFIEESASGITAQLLASGRHPQITVLAAQPTLHLSIDDFIGLLFNVPSVSDLALENCSLNIDHMEAIHSHLRSLTSLKVKMMSMPPIRRPTMDIQPANQINAFVFHCNGAPLMSSHTHWFQYIRQKYPNLTLFEYIDDFKGVNEEEEEELYREFKDDGFLPLLRTYGRQLQTFGLDTELIPVNIFEMLDEADCRIKHLKIKTSGPYQFLSRMARTEQRNCVETLEVDLADDDENIQWIKKLTKIRDFRIDYTKESLIGEVHLKDVLEGCSRTLESLSLKTKVIMYTFSDTAIYQNIKKLELSQVEIPTDFDAFLSVAFTQVRDLRFKACKFKGNTFNISIISLEYFEIITNIPQDAVENVLVITLIDQQRRWYSFGHQYRADGNFKSHNSNVIINPPFKIIPYPQLSCTPSFTLICSSIRDMSIRIADFHY